MNDVEVYSELLKLYNKRYEELLNETRFSDYVAGVRRPTDLRRGRPPRQQEAWREDLKFYGLTAEEFPLRVWAEARPLEELDDQGFVEDDGDFPF